MKHKLLLFILFIFLSFFFNNTYIINYLNFIHGWLAINANIGWFDFFVLEIAFFKTISFFLSIFFNLIGFLLNLLSCWVIFYSKGINLYSNMCLHPYHHFNIIVAPDILFIIIIFFMLIFMLYIIIQFYGFNSFISDFLKTLKKVLFSKYFIILFLIIMSHYYFLDYLYYHDLRGQYIDNLIFWEKGYNLIQDYFISLYWTIICFIINSPDFYNLIHNIDYHYNPVIIGFFYSKSHFITCQYFLFEAFFLSIKEIIYFIIVFTPRLWSFFLILFFPYLKIFSIIFFKNNLVLIYFLIYNILLYVILILFIKYCYFFFSSLKGWNKFQLWIYYTFLIIFILLIIFLVYKIWFVCLFI